MQYASNDQILLEDRRTEQKRGILFHAQILIVYLKHECGAINIVSTYCVRCWNLTNYSDCTTVFSIFLQATCKFGFLERHFMVGRNSI